MALDSHWKVAYSETIKELAGFQNRSLLKEFVEKDAKRGESALFDTIAPADEAEFNDMVTDTNYRADFETIGSPVLDDWLAIQTPHMNVEQDKVLCAPYENIWAHSFRKKDEIAENANTNSIKLKQGMKKIFKNQDKWILDALSRATEQRGKDIANAVPVAFPVTQQLNIASGTFDKSVCSAILRIFENNYNDTDPIYCVISPEAKESLINQSGDTIHSSDFVDRKGLERGELPNIYGVHMIVHPLVKDYAGAYDDAFFAWTPSAITYNQFDPLSTEMDQMPTQKFNTVLQVCEYIGACRIDDLGVVQGTLGTP